MLSGEPPFYDDDAFELFEQIKKCEFDFKKPVWRSVSTEAKDLVQKLLVADPLVRLDAAGVLAHPWLSGKRCDVVCDQVTDQLVKLNDKYVVDNFNVSTCSSENVEERD